MDKPKFFEYSHLTPDFAPYSTKQYFVESPIVAITRLYLERLSLMNERERAVLIESINILNSPPAMITYPDVNEAGREELLRQMSRPKGA